MLKNRIGNPNAIFFAEKNHAIAGNNCMAGRTIKAHLCAAGIILAMPETEIPFYGDINHCMIPPPMTCSPS